MSEVHFIKDYKTIKVTEHKSLMDLLLKAKMPVASSCLGKAVCSLCRIQIIKGMENLSLPSDVEQKLKKEQGLAENFRISCQVKVLGDVTIDTTYW